MSVFACVLAGLPVALEAQVSVHPESVEPAAWVRFALRVVNQRSAAVVRIRLEVPEAVTILGTQAPGAWAFAAVAATDTTPQTIEWVGGGLAAGRFEEFAFLGRVVGDARRRELVFPVTLTRADGTTLRWGAGPGGTPPPRVMIRGSTFISSWGAAALGGAALGVAVLALAIAAFRRPVNGGGIGPGS